MANGASSIASMMRYQKRVMTAVSRVQAIVSGKKPGRVDPALAHLAEKFIASTKLPGRVMDADVVTDYVDHGGVLTSRANAEVLATVSPKIKGSDVWLYMVPVKQGLLPAGIVGFDMALCKEINPNGLPLSVLYAGAGSDASNVLLTTDATRVLMVNKMNTYHQLPEAVSRWNEIPNKDPVKFSMGYTVAAAFNRLDLSAMFVRELKSMGVERNDVISFNRIGKGPMDGAAITFRWRHPAQKRKVDRSFTLLHQDILQFDEWRGKTENLTTGGMDVYLERAANEIPEAHDKFLLSVASVMTSGGMMVLDDTEMQVHAEANDAVKGVFTKPYSTDWMKWWEQFIPRTGPYGWKLEIRRKLV